MQKEAWVIWHHLKDSKILDSKEIVGISLDYNEAVAIVAKLNDADSDKPPSWSKNLNYWHESFSVLNSEA